MDNMTSTTTFKDASFLLFGRLAEDAGFVPLRHPGGFFCSQLVFSDYAVDNNRKCLLRNTDRVVHQEFQLKLAATAVTKKRVKRNIKQRIILVIVLCIYSYAPD